MQNFLITFIKSDCDPKNDFLLVTMTTSNLNLFAPCKNADL